MFNTYVHKQDLVLNNVQRLICDKLNQPINLKDQQNKNIGTELS